MSTAPSSIPPAPASGRPTDQQDERLRDRSGLKGGIAAVVDQIRGGDLGVLPVVLGLAVIWTIFQILNPGFLSSANLVNLLMESSAVGVISLGIVCVLLVAQIDLSVGSVSGLSAAILGILFVNQRWNVVLAVAVAVLVGAFIGFVYGQIFNRFGVPSFLITLAGLLSFLGLQLFVLKGNGTINIPFDSPLVNFAQLAFVPPALSYLFVVLAAGSLFVIGFSTASARRRAGLSARPIALIATQSVALLIALGLVVYYLNITRGVGWMFVFFVALVLVMHYMLTRTKWGRSVYAVGGNVEAARRSGINVRWVYTSVFMICTTFAAVGGILAASRLASASQSSGTGDVNLNAIAAAVIGGTSLFGGRGTAFAALLGIIVIQSISSGLTLLNLDSSFRFIVTGVVLLLAVTLDAISRRSRTSHGRA
ncbi:MAG: sugar ABC transporter permease [Actinomycetota bacterium]